MRTSDFDPISVGIFHKQLNKFILFVLIVFSVLVLRLWYLQILNGRSYRERSELNRIRLQDIPPFRGMIYDRNGKVIADNRPSYDLYIIPEDIQDRVRLIEELTRLIHLDPKMVATQLEESSPGRAFIPVLIKKDMPRDELGIIETHRFSLPGVIVQMEPQRNYPYRELAFHLLGYLGQISDTQLRSGQYPDNKSGDLIGKSGIEMKWQTLLSGTRGGEQVEVDAAGRKIRTLSRKPPISGANVCLTIDMDLQRLAEKALTGKKGAIVALDPNTGEILALASSPSVDPNLFVGGIDKTTWNDISNSPEFPLQNRALCGQYPPASVFKIIVALAGLEEGVIDPDETITCRGIFFLGRHPFRCWKRYGHGDVNLHTALVRSCDVYFYQTGLALGIDKIAEYAGRFGLGRVSGLGLGQEREGLIPTSQWKMRRFAEPWQTGETVSASIGQSFLLVTPIQLAGLIGAVFNGGVWYRPQATRWVGNSEAEKDYEFEPVVEGRVHIRPGNLKLVQDALVGVVNEPHGTGAGARIKGITVAGKTGTAQVVAMKTDVKEGDEIPLQYRDHAWFVAVAPAESPRIALAIMVEHGEHGSSNAPVAKELIEAYLGKPEPKENTCLTED